MTLEREIKIAVDSVDRVRELLVAAEARRHSEAALETNSVWDRGDELAARGCLLRLREDGHGARLTYKGPASFFGTAKVREELEIAVGDFATAAKLLERLGYERRSGYQKLREEWRLGDSMVALDRTRLGDFVEVEGADAPDVARRLGLDPGAGERLSYLGLWEAHRREHPEAPDEMSFP